MTTYATVDDYIAAQELAVSERLTLLRRTFHKILPHTQESMRYDMPAFTVGEYYLYIGAYKNHIGMYPVSDIPKLNEQILRYHGAGTKDSLHFKHSEPLPLTLIEAIITAKNNKN